MTEVSTGNRRSTEYLIYGIIFPAVCIGLLCLFSTFVENIQTAIQLIIFGLCVGSIASYFLTKRELNVLQAEGQVKTSMVTVIFPSFSLVFGFAFMNVSILFLLLSLTISFTITYTAENLRWEKKYKSIQFSKGRSIFALPKQEH